MLPPFIFSPYILPLSTQKAFNWIVCHCHSAVCQLPENSKWKTFSPMESGKNTNSIWKVFPFLRLILYPLWMANRGSAFSFIPAVSPLRFHIRIFCSRRTLSAELQPFNPRSWQIIVSFCSGKTCNSFPYFLKWLNEKWFATPRARIPSHPFRRILMPAIIIGIQYFRIRLKREWK